MNKNVLQNMNFEELTKDNNIGWARAREMSRDKPDNDIDVLFIIGRPFKIKSFEPVYEKLDVGAAYLPVRQKARGINTTIPEANVDTIGDVDANIWDIDPKVVVANNYYNVHQNSFHNVYPLVMMHHGATLANREELDGNKIRPCYEYADHYCAPGDLWEDYIGPYTNTEITITGLPEADTLVDSISPNNKTILFAPTNMRWGKGCFNNVAHNVIDTFKDTEWKLLFRPHPHDTHREKDNVAEECRERIEDIDNIEFDDDRTPFESMKMSDILITDDSGLLTEWLHTGRPVIQITDIKGKRDLKKVGVHSNNIPSVSFIDDLYNNGYGPWDEQIIENTLESLGIPMDGKSSECVATIIESYCN